MENTSDELLIVLAEVRRLHPDWRFGQTICNLAFMAGGAKAGITWDVEDSELLAAAKKHLAEKQGKAIGSRDPSPA